MKRNVLVKRSHTLDHFIKMWTERLEQWAARQVIEQQKRQEEERKLCELEQYWRLAVSCGASSSGWCDLQP